MKKLTLEQIGLKYNSDKSSVHHKYLDLYDKHFSGIRYDENNILEIGIFNGDSLKIFSEYFENSNLYAFDVFDKRSISINNCNISVGDQSDRNFLNSFSDIRFDMILDDGSHKMSHQQISLGILFKFLKPGGIYVIEDLHTSLPDFVENINYGISYFGLNETGDNNTIDFIKKIGDGKNHYLTEEEIEYLKNNIKSVDIIETAERDVDIYWQANGKTTKPSSDKSITSIIIKK